MSKYWAEKPYYSLDYYLKHTFGEKVYRLSLDIGTTCPNRDGLISTKGCIFCSSKGSGDFSAPRAFNITKQIETAKEYVSKKYHCNSYIAYFQAFTGTYGPFDMLKNAYTEAISHPDIKAISIATRPDCLSEEILDLLSKLNNIKPVWIELGLQTIHPKTAVFIRRGYELSCFEEAVKKLRSININVIPHVILCLPNETRTDMLETINYLNKQDIQGIKIHLLHILTDTDLYTYYLDHPFYIPTMDEYFELLGDCINHLRDDIVIHRLTGDGPTQILYAPTWTIGKRFVLNKMSAYFKEHEKWQGKDYNG
ncbi:MAG: TIGR01212 family radical SAM protein [Suipraeoptans sp.]